MGAKQRAAQRVMEKAVERLKALKRLHESDNEWLLQEVVAIQRKHSVSLLENEAIYENTWESGPWHSGLPN